MSFLLGPRVPSPGHKEGWPPVLPFRLYCDSVYYLVESWCLTAPQSLQRTSRNSGLLAWLPELAQVGSVVEALCLEKVSRA